MRSRWIEAIGGGIDAYLLSTPNAKLAGEALRLKRVIAKVVAKKAA